MLAYLIIVITFLTRASLLVSATTTASESCIRSCSDWSIVLGHCRGQFDPSPHQTNITYASQFIQCLCDGSKDNANEMLGSEAMAAAAQTCTECVTTPAIIVEDLQTFLGICVVLAQNGTAAQSMAWAPFGYSILTFGDDGKAKQAVPAGALV